MFFRREKPKPPTFEDLLQRVRQAGFTVQTGSGGQAQISRGDFVAIVVEEEGGKARILRSGIRLGNEIGYLLSSGYQMLWGTDTGNKEAATAAELRGLHAFQEDLNEALGLTSFYNTSLGTVSARHAYDRVKDRDAGAPARPWEARERTTAAKS